jgi:hypothetical protein
VLAERPGVARPVWSPPVIPQEERSRRVVVEMLTDVP